MNPITITFPHMLIELGRTGEVTARSHENRALPMSDGYVLALDRAPLSPADVERLDPQHSRAELENLASDLFYISAAEAEFFDFLTEQEVSS